MSHFLQLHLLTFYPPSNLNRDDTGRPKTAVVGGEQRLRISSQSLKRAWRGSDVFKTRLDGHLGSRTQRFGSKIAEHLVARGTAPEAALSIAREIASAFGKVKDAKDKSPTYTEQLAFLSPEEQAAAFALAEARADGRTEAVEAKTIARSLLKGADTAADIAMFGRMFADNPDFNREAAVQVAHAFTTHRVSVEDDYYTAVDDLKRPAEDAGAGFVGEAGFGSGVFYLYLCIDRDLLAANLTGDPELGHTAVEALIEAAANVGPRGKQASFASRARTSYVRAEAGSDQPRSLATAFVRPVKAEDILVASIERLEATAKAIDRAYGSGDVKSLTMNALPEGSGSLRDIIAFARA